VQLLARLEDPASTRDPNLLRKIGSACESIGRRTEARVWYQLAIARNPLDRDAQQRLVRLGTSPTDIPPVAVRP
jgi:hypothetical protein